MTMYKPGTKLIMGDLWAAAAAHKLGFDVQSSTSAHTVRGLIGESIWVRRFMEIAEKWRITVTESGPNAAERFLPQMHDCYWDYWRTFVINDSVAKGHHVPYAKPEGCVTLQEARDRFLKFGIDKHGSKVMPIRIIERNGIPFPQFSEVIEP